MKKRTCLENLVFQTGLTYNEFSDKVGVNRRTFETQMQKKKNHLKHAFEYARILGVEEIKGYSDGVYFELKMKINDIEVL